MEDAAVHVMSKRAKRYIEFSLVDLLLKITNNFYLFFIEKIVKQKAF
jgi:hypothetical protein